MMLFRIEKSPIHGEGWFATQNIPTDTPIYDEHVCIRVPFDMYQKHVDEQHLDEVLSQLQDKEHDAIMNLSGDSPLHKLWMNGVPFIDHGSDVLGCGPKRELGIYLKCAKLNHSCRPNAARASEASEQEGTDNVMSVISQKEIQIGEEITITYLDDNFAVARDRHQQMISKICVGHYWETCKCCLCTGTDDMLYESDKRRRMLYAYRDQLMDGSLQVEFIGTKFLPLMAEEGLPTALMGNQALFKMTKMWYGFDPRTMTREKLNSVTFVRGAKVVLHKLKARPELNGNKGTVVYGLNKKTGRLGILLDSSTTKKPIAIKPENLCLQRETFITK